ncbi:acylneuraminate cytidylyltransferase family protein [Luminiphilus sp.]|nr:acylneuraminate cytidylyltransferase family protein [Luminiphilus sp.]
MTKLAIIPARAGSKRLKNKNILELAGKPLICWTVDAAIESGLFSQILVSTDSVHISHVIRNRYGATKCRVQLRPDELASDTASTSEVIRHHLVNTNYTDVCLLQPTSPLRVAGDIVSSFNVMKENVADCVVGVTQLRHPMEWSFNETAEFQGFLRSLGEKRSQDYIPRYIINGAIYWFTRRSFFEFGTHLNGNCALPFVMPAERSIDIDENLDFLFAAALLEKQQSPMVT